jgi:hypothetical protein
VSPATTERAAQPLTQRESWELAGMALLILLAIDRFG